MKYYDIALAGIFKLKSDTSLPLWTSADKGRMIYDDSTNGELFIGLNDDWVGMLTKHGGVLDGQLSTTETNYGSYFKNTTISDTTPSGGSNGDVWLQYITP
jgi:hypothetical protein